VLLLFNSFAYILLFLPIAVIGIAALKRRFGPRAAQAGILLASGVFYCWFKPVNVAYPVASILANWWLAQKIGRAPFPRNKRWLQLGLLLNICYLSAFKYSNFLIGTLPFMRGHEHLLPDLDFPLGISFFTLTQVMYLVDCYEGTMQPASLFDHATFVSFFPYVISGPIARASRTVPQFAYSGGVNGVTKEQVARGLYLFSIGLLKKVVLAEGFSHVANYGFETANNRSTLEVLVFTCAYAMQIYFDFSGYSDMAIGSAGMLGIEIPRNFDMPFRAKSIIEFWQRWHISLTAFITTYLYTPILRSFNRPTIVAASFSTIAAMAVAGLWHGPSWTFVLFGLVHGIALAINQIWRKKQLPKLPAWLSWMATFALVNVAFIFFRSATIGNAMKLLGELFDIRHAFGMTNLSVMHVTVNYPIFGLPVALGLLAAFVGKSSEQAAREFNPTAWSSPLTACALLISFLYMNSQVAADFIYFKF
jgi:alginate O-acetyltransferase complex protein AlgI